MSVQVRDVVVAFGERRVLDRVALDVADHEVVALLGPSGSGKSTLLRVIAGLVVPDAGTVVVDGNEVTNLPAHRRDIGMVFQDQQLFPHLDVGHNIAFGLRMQGAHRAARTARVAEMLSLVGLTGFERRRIDGLSGGEATRVALARSLAPRPRVLLLDEPLTGLDATLHDRLAADLRTLLRGTTAILVTHDPDEAAAIADRVVTMHQLMYTIVELTAEETHALRREVLRRDTPTDNVDFAEDHWPGAVHLGVRRGDDLVATSSWIPRDDQAVQLRGMATAWDLQGSGVGGMLLEHGCDRFRAAGVRTVWARARDAALDFYVRHGFETVGDGFIDETTQLPHHLVTRSLH